MSKRYAHYKCELALGEALAQAERERQRAVTERKNMYAWQNKAESIAAWAKRWKAAAKSYGTPFRKMFRDVQQEMDAQRQRADDLAALALSESEAADRHAKERGYAEAQLAQVKGWKFCPECGCEEFTGRDFYSSGSRICSGCGQEWFTDIDYSGVVRTNLGKRQRAEAQLAALREALAHYAEKKHWDPFLDTLSDKTFSMGDYEGNLRVENGSRARAALASGAEPKPEEPEG
jgi:hypothetical protein